MHKAKIWMTAISLGIPGIASANAGPGYVSNLVPLKGDHSYLFDQSGSRDQIPSCGSGIPLRWAVDASTPFGQSLIATILTAYALHKPVAINGTGNCDAHPDTESVELLVMLD